MKKDENELTDYVKAIICLAATEDIDSLVEKNKNSK